jgi:hypothetical protein
VINSVTGVVNVKTGCRQKYDGPGLGTWVVTVVIETLQCRLALSSASCSPVGYTSTLEFMLNIRQTSTPAAFDASQPRSYFNSMPAAVYQPQVSSVRIRTFIPVNQVNGVQILTLLTSAGSLDISRLFTRKSYSHTLRLVAALVLFRVHGRRNRAGKQPRHISHVRLLWSRSQIMQRTQRAEPRKEIHQLHSAGTRFSARDYSG